MEKKKVELANAEANLRVAEEVVAQKQKALEEALELLKVLECEYENLILEKEKIQRTVDDCQEKLRRSDKLTSGLATERTRWARKA